MLYQPAEYLVEHCQELFIGGSVHQQVIDVDDDIGDAIDDSLHEALKAGGASQQAHWTGDPLELAHGRDSECGVRPGLLPFARSLQ